MTKLKRPFNAKLEKATLSSWESLTMCAQIFQKINK